MRPSKPNTPSISSPDTDNRLLINVRGTVQGVGFRPFVLSLASALGLGGYVENTSDGVVMEVEGERLDCFIERLRKEAPPLARISSVDIKLLPSAGYREFRILKSRDSGSFTLISPDVSACDDCIKELFDPEDRRYRYPFINCTNCGPRYSITRRVPYDRPNTTMAAFEMCPSCKAEYENPSDRRFHAQPNACLKCGPRVRGVDAFGRHANAGSPVADPIGEAVELLKKGAIVAIKGIGGFHLACDATSGEAVKKLRARKRRNNKPFALMARDIEAIKRYCIVSDEEEGLLNTNRRPIVILRKRGGAPDASLPDSIAPGSKKLGFMLPYTPLHYLLFDGAPNGTSGTDGLKGPVVLTSGNLSEEPIQTVGSEAVEKLGDIADFFLDHDRDIFMRVDDSVLKTTGGGTMFIRRARGYAPEPIALPEDGPEVLAVGADLKNTFTLTKGDCAIVSQHIGDMENIETTNFFEETLRNLMDVYRVNPVAVAHDMHPGYMTTQWVRENGLQPRIKAGAAPSGGAGGASLKAVACQHHHAHIASVMAEKGLKKKIIGVAFDGTGYGPDGTLWGGEFLMADALDFKRAGHLRRVPLPGGEAAIREPWRAAISYVHDAFGGDSRGYLKRLGFFERYGERRVLDVLGICGIGEVSPLSSGAGRLFDAVSAMLDISDKNTFEGEAAMALEAEAEDDIYEDYPLNIIDRGWPCPIEVDFSHAVISIINDLLRGVERKIIAARFHNTVIEAALRVVVKLSQASGVHDVVLSGGVFQNDLLLRGMRGRLRSEGFDVFVNEVVPANDGGISLGQAYILRERLKAGQA